MNRRPFLASLLGLVALPFRGRPSRASSAPAGQPMPSRTTVVHLPIPGKVVTAIMRLWKPGDSGPAGRCKRCPRCYAKGDSCLIVVEKYIDKEDAPTLSTVGGDWIRF